MHALSEIVQKLGKKVDMLLANKQSEVKLKSNLDEKLETLMSSETSAVKNDHIKNTARVNINEIRTQMSSAESNII